MNRLEIVSKIIDWDDKHKDLISQLSNLEWDYEGPQFVLNEAHISSILTRFLESNLTKEEVEGWANFIEAREDIDLGVFDEIIFKLANPSINEDLNEVLAQRILREI